MTKRPAQLAGSQDAEFPSQLSLTANQLQSASIKLPHSPLAMCLYASSEIDQPLGGTLHTPTAQALAVGLGTAAASLLASSALFATRP